jgi:hypothetical protein
MNRRSLVLAADSAATVSRWEQGRKQERYFKGSNKIFQLSNDQPIGIMIYDSADLHGLPWEIIVKTFRDALGKRSFANVEEYGLEFFKFIESHRGLFPEYDLDAVVIENVDQIMIRWLRALPEDQRVKDVGSDAAALSEVKNALLREGLEAILMKPLRSPFDDAAVDAVRDRLGGKLEAEAKTDARLFANDASIDHSLLVELGLQALLRDDNNVQAETGIVIAGFGKDDFFPSFIEFSCTGFVIAHLQFKKNGEHAISRYDSGFFKTFAMSSMTDTFTMGFGPDVYTSVRSHLRKSLQDFANKLTSDVGKTSKKVEDFIDDALKQHTDGWTEAVFQNHARPLRQVIGSLPIEELANLAETLVMLESLKEKVTSPSESVGGPIDVAIITKHEGFVWGKRKLYFDPKINPRYFLRQQSSIQGGHGDR